MDTPVRTPDITEALDRLAKVSEELTNRVDEICARLSRVMRINALAQTCTEAGKEPAPPERCELAWAIHNFVTKLSEANTKLSLVNAGIEL